MTHLILHVTVPWSDSVWQGMAQNEKCKGRAHLEVMLHGVQNNEPCGRIGQIWRGWNWPCDKEIYKAKRLYRLNSTVEVGEQFYLKFSLFREKREKKEENEKKKKGKKKKKQIKPKKNASKETYPNWLLLGTSDMIGPFPLRKVKRKEPIKLTSTSADGFSAGFQLWFKFRDNEMKKIRRLPKGTFGVKTFSGKVRPNRKETVKQALGNISDKTKGTSQEAVKWSNKYRKCIDVINISKTVVSCGSLLRETILTETTIFYKSKGKYFQGKGKGKDRKSKKKKKFETDKDVKSKKKKSPKISKVKKSKKPKQQQQQEQEEETKVEIPELDSLSEDDSEEDEEENNSDDEVEYKGTFNMSSEDDSEEEEEKRKQMVYAEPALELLQDSSSDDETDDEESKVPELE